MKRNKKLLNSAAVYLNKNARFDYLLTYTVLKKNTYGSE